MARELLFQGAESRVYAGTHLELPVVFKVRFKKSYRAPELDAELTKTRLRNEARNLVKCRAAGIDCPGILDLRHQDGLICLERVPGPTCAEFLKSKPTQTESDKLAQDLGSILSRFHDKVKIVHGDLTTSNIILRKNADDSNYHLCIIDFGLASQTDSVEDRAVDLYVLTRSVESSHPDYAENFNKSLLQSYAGLSVKSAATVARFEVVKLRGRKRVTFEAFQSVQKACTMLRYAYRDYEHFYKRFNKAKALVPQPRRKLSPPCEEGISNLTEDWQILYEELNRRKVQREKRNSSAGRSSISIVPPETKKAPSRRWSSSSSSVGSNESWGPPRPQNMVKPTFLPPLLIRKAGKGDWLGGNATAGDIYNND